MEGGPQTTHTPSLASGTVGSGGRGEGRTGRKTGGKASQASQASQAAASSSSGKAAVKSVLNPLAIVSSSGKAPSEYLKGMQKWRWSWLFLLSCPGTPVVVASVVSHTDTSHCQVGSSSNTLLVSTKPSHKSQTKHKKNGVFLYTLHIVHQMCVLSLPSIRWTTGTCVSAIAVCSPASLLPSGARLGV